MSQEKQLVAGTIEELKENLELFYQQKNQEALKQFQEMIGKLVSMVDTLYVYKTNHEGFPFDETKLKDALVEAMNAMQEQDLILVADIMQYDFIEYVEGLLGDME